MQLMVHTCKNNYKINCFTSVEWITSFPSTCWYMHMCPNKDQYCQRTLQLPVIVHLLLLVQNVIRTTPSWINHICVVIHYNSEWKLWVTQSVESPRVIMQYFNEWGLWETQSVGNPISGISTCTFPKFTTHYLKQTLVLGCCSTYKVSVLQ